MRERNRERERPRERDIDTNSERRTEKRTNGGTAARTHLDKAVGPVLLILEGCHHHAACQDGHEGVTLRLEVDGNIPLEQTAECLQTINNRCSTVIFAGICDDILM